MIRHALDKLFTQGHFSICIVDQICELLNLSDKTPAYRLLRPLHCVDYASMDPELRDKLPHLVNECLRPPPRCVATDVALDGVEFGQ